MKFFTKLGSHWVKQKMQFHTIFSKLIQRMKIQPYKNIYDSIVYQYYILIIMCIGWKTTISLLHRKYGFLTW